MTPTSIDKLRKILALERRQGHSNRAVIGGLDAFLRLWLDEAQREAVSAEVREAAGRLLGYGDLDTVARADLVGQVMEQIDESAASPARARSVPGASVRAGSVAPPAPAAAGPSGSQPAEGRSRRREASGPSAVSAASSSGGPSEAAAAEGRPTSGAARATSRSDRAAELGRPVVHLQGVGQKLAERLSRLGVLSVRDLLYLAPLRYSDFRNVRPICRLQLGQTSTAVGSVWDVRGRDVPGGRHVLTVVLSDTTATVDCTFFNQPYLEREFRPGRRIVVSGRVEAWAGRLVFRSPEWEPLDQDLVHTARLVPVYPLTQGIGQRWLRRLVKTTTDTFADALPDPLPVWLRQAYALPDLGQAIRHLHAPPDDASLEAAERRLAFDEILALELWERQTRRAWRSRQGRSLAGGAGALEGFLSALPFSLTVDQKRAVDEIAGDMSSSSPMIRLLQGDVGSGKTVVAAAAAAVAVAAGTQVVIMAPTEILVDQHVASLTRLLGPLGYRTFDPGGEPGSAGGHAPSIARLAGSMRRQDKAAVQEAARSGAATIVVGTHAVVQEGVAFRRLGLAIVDEQHRFGVLQRAELVTKGQAEDPDSPDSRPAAGGVTPHLLIMSATPIPRTMAQVLHADLDQTVITEMPPGRQPVATRWVGREERERAYQYLRHRVHEGGQAYIVFPVVEGSDEDRLAAVDEHRRLSREVFPDLRLGLVHGRMSAEDKERAMSQFRAGETQVLVATSVIEVGVDVPNATVMLVDGADRFGLAQLHQLRGRVGRGREESACLLLADDPSDAARERLEALTRTNDGLELAELDLRLRGPGDYFGVQQSGLVERFRFARCATEGVIGDVDRAANDVAARDPDLSTPEMSGLAQAVSAFGQAKERA